MTFTVQQLTIEETGANILNACITQDGAIDDCETSETEILLRVRLGRTCGQDQRHNHHRVPASLDAEVRPA